MQEYAEACKDRYIFKKNTTRYLWNAIITYISFLKHHFIAQIKRRSFCTKIHTHYGPTEICTNMPWHTKISISSKKYKISMTCNYYIDMLRNTTSLQWSYDGNCTKNKHTWNIHSIESHNAIDHTELYKNMP